MGQARGSIRRLVRGARHPSTADSFRHNQQRRLKNCYTDRSLPDVQGRFQSSFTLDHEREGTPLARVFDSLGSS